MIGGFIKLNRSEVVEELIKDHKTWALFSLIAYRARYKNSFNKDGLEVSEALIGDHDSIGLTRQEYRTSKGKLERWHFITTRATTRGTIAKLTDTSIWDVNKETNQPSEQPKSNHQATTNKKERKKEDNICSPVIDYLNSLSGRGYKSSTAKTQKLINARVDEGRTLDDFKKVIEVKCKEWLHDSKMSAYLAPETLFSESHFEKYLNQTVNKSYPVNESMTKDQVKNLFQ